MNYNMIIPIYAFYCIYKQKNFVGEMLNKNKRHFVAGESGTCGTTREIAFFGESTKFFLYRVPFCKQRSSLLVIS